MTRIDYGAKGKRNERAVRLWARANGFPGADRIIRTGAGKGYNVRDDEGDLWLCPGVIVQVKSLDPPNRAERAVPAWMTLTESQRVASKADVGVLVVRRPGTSDVGEWWAFLNLWQLGCLATDHAPWHLPETLWWGVPWRTEMRHVALLLRASGYGTALDAVEVAG